MWARKRFDIGWADLLRGALKCVAPSGLDDATWNGLTEDDPRVLKCLSVRTGVDLLLSACSFPPGSEVLMSALNIEGMFRIVSAHGLVPVPLDIDPDRLLPSASEVRKSVTQRTRMVVVAHLFGAHSDLDEIEQVCADLGLALVEDNSQSFAGAFRHPQGACIAQMYSFGSIKTATALGGAVITLRDAELAQHMKTHEAKYPAYSRTWFLARIAKYSFLKLLSYRGPYGILTRLLGRHHDRVVSSLARGFGSDTDLERVRKRPPEGMLALLARRLGNFRPHRFERERKRGEWLQKRSQESHLVPGSSAETHQFSLFPVVVEEPVRLIEALRGQGFDSTMRGSLVVLDAPSSSAGHEASQARDLLDRMVFLPFYEAMPDAELARMAAIMSDFSPESRAKHSHTRRTQ